VPGRGYRFSLPLDHDRNGAEPALARATPLPAPSSSGPPSRGDLGVDVGAESAADGYLQDVSLATNPR
jgi:hypothetical protein